ncbi:MAG: hypothetical protein E7566_02175 [Ruminococcaceae bacterium]|nr:hypothetical protein [Oscillospiraceae bacterium]
MSENTVNVTAEEKDEQEIIAENEEFIAFTQRKFNRITKIVLAVIAVFLFFKLPSTGRLLWLQYSPLIITIIFSFVANARRSSYARKHNLKLGPSPEENKRLMVPVSPESGDKTKLMLYYAWQAVVIIVQVVVIIMLTVRASGGFFDGKLTTLVVSTLMGLICYAVACGQGRVVSAKAVKKRKKVSSDEMSDFERMIFPNKDREWVPGTGTYRDKNGNHYDSNGIPVPTPIEIKIKK